MTPEQIANLQAIARAADDLEATLADAIESETLILTGDGIGISLTAVALNGLHDALTPYRLDNPLPLDETRCHV